MATSGSFNTSKVDNFYFTFSWSRTGYSSSANEHYIYYEVVAHNTAGKYRTVYLKNLWINGSQKFYTEGTSGNGKSYYDGNVVTSGSITIPSYNSAGNGNIAASFEAGVGKYPAANTYGEGSWELDKIPRNFTSTPTLSSKTRGMNTYVLNWGTSENCSKVVLYVNGAWNGEWNVSGKSGTITATGLSPNTTYNMYIVCTRADSGQTLNSSTNKYTTYNHATVTSASDVNDEQNPSMNYSNPSGSYFNPYIELMVNGSITDSIVKSAINSTSGTYTFELTEAEKTLIYKRSSNSTTSSIGIRYGAQTLVDNKATYWSWLDKTMTIVNANPIFTDFSIEEKNEKVFSLTDNRYRHIKKYSDIKVAISSGNKMIAQKEATPISYNVIIGEKNKSITYSENYIETIINNIESNKVEVYAIDSRGKQTSVTKSLDIIEYSEVNLNNIVFERKNGVEETVIIIGNGNWTNVDFGNVVNSIDTFAFRMKKKALNKWSEWFSILEMFHINEDGTIVNKVENEFLATTFEFGEEYDIQVKIEDKLSSSTKNISVNSGKILMSALKEHGVCFGGVYDKNIGGALQVNGKNIEDLTADAVGDTLPIGTVVDFYGDEIPGNWVEAEDEEWKTLSLSSTFTYYEGDTNNIPRCRKIGKLVEVQGCLAPKSDLVANTAYTIFTLPKEYRPSRNVYKLCQGTTTRIWLLTVYPSGDVTLSRYREGANFVAPYASNWFPFQVMFFVD